MVRKKNLCYFLMLLFWTFFVACTEDVCPDACSQSLHLKSGEGCDCICSGGSSFNQLMEKWDNNRICITAFAENEDPYILLSHQANFLSCDRSDYLLLYLEVGDRISHPDIQDAEMGFFKINFYGEVSRNLWAYTTFPNNDTLYTGFGLSPTVANRSFLCDEPSFHSSKLYFSGDLLNMEKTIYENQSDWENETNAVMSYHFTFLALEHVN